MSQKLVELTDGSAAYAGTFHWQPSQDYADLILEASICESKLSGVISAVNYDKQAGTGRNVQVRLAPRRAAQGPIVNGGCLSVTSSTFSTATVTIQQYGDADELYDISIFATYGNLKETLFNEMARGLGVARDVAMINAIFTASHLTYFGSLRFKSRVSTEVSCGSRSTQSTYCCGYAYNLYNSIVSVKANIDGRGCNADTVIVHPTVAAWFKYKDYAYAPTGMVTFNTDGSLKSIAGMNVIETCNMTACNTTAKATMAIVLDSTRAFAEAWGKRPEFTESYQNLCNKYYETVWMYWGVSIVSYGAIGMVVNPQPNP